MFGHFFGEQTCSEARKQDRAIDRTQAEMAIGGSTG
jgi:hypothetical protein